MNRIKRNIKAYLFITPSFIGFITLYLIPFIVSFYFSLTLSGYSKELVGFVNYVNVLNSPAFRLACNNTFVFMIISIPLGMIFSLFLSLLIYRDKNIFLPIVLIVMPIIMPSSSVTGFFRSLFGDMLDGDYAMIAVILIYIWRTTGFYLLIYLVGLNKINPELREAAQLDGANSFQYHRKIIIPLLTPSSIFVAILSIMNAFKVYKDIYVLQGSYPNQKIYMLQHYMINTFLKLDYVKLASAAYMFSCVIFIIAFFIFVIEKKFIKQTYGD